MASAHSAAQLGVPQCGVDAYLLTDGGRSVRKCDALNDGRKGKAAAYWLRLNVDKSLSPAETWPPE
ncbi:hypothetical protein BC2230_20671 [Burkholderia cepacia]